MANAYQGCVDLDHWIRRRVRMCYWRQWRKPRTKVQNLLKRGVRIQAAVACGIRGLRSNGTKTYAKDIYY
ncbi:TPA: group II intron maturase-specific domain-containing protein [Enterobacter asburiae]